MASSTCPHCSSTESKRHDLGRNKCLSCGKTYKLVADKGPSPTPMGNSQGNGELIIRAAEEGFPIRSLMRIFDKEESEILSVTVDADQAVNYCDGPMEGEVKREIVKSLLAQGVAAGVIARVVFWPLARIQGVALSIGVEVKYEQKVYPEPGPVLPTTNTLPTAPVLGAETRPILYEKPKAPQEVEEGFLPALVDQSYEVCPEGMDPDVWASKRIKPHHLKGHTNAQIALALGMDEFDVEMIVISDEKKWKSEMSDEDREAYVQDVAAIVAQDRLKNPEKWKQRDAEHARLVAEEEAAALAQA